MTRGLLIHENGMTEIVTYFDFRDIQKIVCGHFEAINFGDFYAYVNETGKLKNLPHNELATAVFQKFAGDHDYIVGKMLVIGNPDRHGNDTKVTQKTLKLIESIRACSQV